MAIPIASAAIGVAPETDPIPMAIPVADPATVQPVVQQGEVVA